MLDNFRARLRAKVNRALDRLAYWTLVVFLVALVLAVLWVIGSGVQSYLALFGIRF